MSKTQKRLMAAFLLLMFVCWSYILFSFGPEKIIEILGTRNAYITLSLVAFLGGSSILFPFPYYILTISLGAAGLNPILLGIAAGLGTLLGDALTYYVVNRGRKLIPHQHTKRLQKSLRWAMQKHPATFPIIAFFYAAFTPLPDDLLIIPAGLTKYPFFRIAIGLVPGKIVFNIILALSGVYGLQLFL